MRKEVVITKPTNDELGLKVFEDPGWYGKDGLIISNFDEMLKIEERCYIKRSEVSKLIEVLKEWYE